MNRLFFKRWFGAEGERHTAEDWNRLADNARYIAAETGAPAPALLSVSEAGALTKSMAQSMESAIAALSEHLGFFYPQYQWIDGDFVSFIDVNRWEYGLWECYRAAGGAGRPEDTGTVETLLFPFSGWVMRPDRSFDQTVPSLIAAAGMNAIIGLSQHQIDQVGPWSVMGPFVTAVGDGSVTVKCSGMMIGGKNLELTLIKAGSGSMQHTISVPASGWVNAGDGTFTRNVAVAGLPATAEGVIGYATGDLAGAMAGVAAGVVMTAQSAGQITLRANTVPSQAINLVMIEVG